MQEARPSLSAAHGAASWPLEAVASSPSPAGEDRLTAQVSEPHTCLWRKSSLDNLPSACLCLVTKSYAVGREFPSQYFCLRGIV